MLKGKKQLTEKDKLKLAVTEETELLKERRHYRLLQTARRSYKSINTLNIQRRVINVLRTEYNELQNDLGVAVSPEAVVQDRKNASQLQKQLNTHAQFKADIKLEEAYLNELDTQITVVQKRLLNLRRNCPNALEDETKLQCNRYTLETLENKLDCQTKRFCLTLSENRKLRDEIKHHLLERAQFSSIWNKLLGNLATARKYMIDLIEMATISYDQREEWVLKLSILRNKANNDYISDTLDMTKILRLIDDEIKLKNFLTIKGQKRILKNLMDTELLKRKEQRKKMQVILEKYTKSLENIKEFMGESKIFKIVQKYMLIEYENYSRFDRVVQLNQEIEKLGDDVALLCIKIDDNKYIINKHTETQVNNIKRLELELEKYRSEADEAENEFKTSDKMLSDILAGIEILFNQCKCSYTPFMELLGNNTSINIFNVHIFLHLLEKRLNDVTINIHYKEDMEYGHFNSKAVIHCTNAVYHDPTIQKMVRANPCPLCTEKAMVGDVIDSLQKVLSTREIEEQLEIARQQEYFHEIIHNVSGCHLPKARAILQAQFE